MPALESTIANHELCASRAGLLGFSEDEERRFGALLESTGCSFNSVPCNTVPETLARYDALVVSAEQDNLATLLTNLITARTPWLLVGIAQGAEAYWSLCLYADEALFRPYRDEEFLLRVSRTLRRRAIGQRPPRDPHQPTVLVADDDPSAVALVRSALRGYSLDCHFANNGCEALEKTRALLPDLVMLDLDMPYMSGLEVLRRIRTDACTKNIKVLLLTASRDLEHIQASSSLGADGYLVKPLNHLLLAGRIKRLLGRGSTEPAE